MAQVVHFGFEDGGSRLRKSMSMPPIDQRTKKRLSRMSADMWMQAKWPRYSRGKSMDLTIAKGSRVRLKGETKSLCDLRGTFAYSSMIETTESKTNVTKTR